MKKSCIVVSMFAVLLFAGCSSSNDNKTSKESSTAASTSATSSLQSSTSSSSSASSSSAKASTEQKTEPSASSAAPTTSGQAQEILAELNQAYPNDALPDAIMTSSEAPFLNAATTGTGDQNNFRILYYAEDYAVALDDPQVNQFTPIASFEKKTYSSAAEATQALGLIEPNGAEVDLGHGITGYSDSGAGNTYLSWKEGNWRITVHGSSVQGENPQQLAKDAVEYFESAYLPAPDPAGQISLEASTGAYQQNKVLWQKGAVVYTVTHGEAMQALKMAVSTAN